jgi:tRNA pseudouridine55 synthase
MNGVLVVDKPSGPTSHDVVGRVRRAIGTRRIGHTGTLDPLATGVLPLVIGRATRLARFLSSDEKEYIADVVFGASTLTYDAAGDERRIAGPPPAEAEGAGERVRVDLSGLDNVLERFRGTFLQVPPVFSAKKVAGTRAYKLARDGRAPDMKPVEVTVTALEVMDRGPDRARLRVTSSSGFYVRSLAHDIGEALGCGAYLGGLRRTRAGAFGLEHAAPLEAIEAEGAAVSERLIPMERLLPHFPSVTLTEAGSRRALHGSLLSPADLAEAQSGAKAEHVRLLDERGALLGIAEPAPGGLLHPAIVLV